MFQKQDNTYNDIRERSLYQWLDDIEDHDDLVVRGGVKLAREYLQHLKDEISKLEAENALKTEYLKKLKNK